MSEHPSKEALKLYHESAEIHAAVYAIEAIARRYATVGDRRSAHETLFADLIAFFARYDSERTARLKTLEDSLTEALSKISPRSGSLG